MLQTKAIDKESRVVYEKRNDTCICTPKAQKDRARGVRRDEIGPLTDRTPPIVCGQPIVFEFNVGTIGAITFALAPKISEEDEIED